MEIRKLRNCYLNPKFLYFKQIVKIFTKQKAKKRPMINYFQTLGSVKNMNTVTYVFTSFKHSNLFNEQNINLSQTLNTYIEFRKNVEYKIPYYLCNYCKKMKFSQNQEAHMNYVTQIRNLREDSDKTQQEIADVLGTSQTMYARYERGANEMPIRHLIKLAQYYNVSLDYLCGLTTVKRPYPLV